MARLAMPLPAAMTPAQAAACAEVLAGARGKVPTPMIAWLQSPELASRAQGLGEALRFRTLLAPALVELATLVCARHWTSHQVWTSHKRHALAAGLDAGIVAAIAARRPPAFADPAEAAAFDLARTLLERHRVPDALYARAVAALGERGVVELVGLVGYYCLVALTVNAFELGLPAGHAPELETEGEGR